MTTSSATHPNTTPPTPETTHPEVATLNKFPFHSMFLTKLKNKLETKFGTNPKREQLLILGGGWATVPLISTLSPNKYHVTVISPNETFSYTPLLPSVVGGRLSIQAVIGRIRAIMDRRNIGRENYIRAWANDVDLTKKLVQCTTTNGGHLALPYDSLVVGVGSVTNDFGIPGVKENALYLKTSDNAETIHNEVMKRITTASYSRSEDDLAKLGHFVCVGAGPSGVETSAEIQDLISNDISKRYPTLAPKMKVSLIEMLPKVLPMFSEKASEVAGEHLRKIGINLELETRVSGIDKDSVTLVGKDNKKTIVPTNLVVWTSGITQTEFAKKLKAKIPQQNPFRLLSVTPQLNVIGSNDIFAVGDCAFVKAPSLKEHRPIVEKELGKIKDLNFLLKHEKKLIQTFPQFAYLQNDKLEPFRNKSLTSPEVDDMLEKIDKMYKPPAPTAQNARQAGIYLGRLLNGGKHHALTPAFIPQYKGRACYIGNDRSIVEFPNGKMFSGRGSFLLWQAMYLSMALTGRRSSLVQDWVRSSIFGRFGA